MEIWLNGDYDERININRLLFQITEDLPVFFSDKDYGNNNIIIAITFFSYPEKMIQRIRFSKKENILYWDILIEYKKIKEAKQDEKKEILANSFIESFDFLDKYKRLDINKDRIKEDALFFFRNVKWIK